MFENIVFWVLAVLAVGASLGVVFVRNIFRSALLLVATFLCVAGFFVLLQAPFLAVVQVLIYVGAISILLVFAIMMTQDVLRGNPPQRRALQAPVLMMAGLLLAALVYVAVKTPWTLQPADAANTQAIAAVYADSPSWLGGLLVQDFVLPFEVVSVLLLAAAIGALALVRERRA